MGSPGVEVLIYRHPPFTSYVPALREPEQAPPSPIYIPFVPGCLSSRSLTGDQPTIQPDRGDVDDEHLAPAEPAVLLFSCTGPIHLLMRKARFLENVVYRFVRGVSLLLPGPGYESLLRALIQHVGESIVPSTRRTAILDGRRRPDYSRGRLGHNRMDACDQTHTEGILLRTTVMTQQSEIVELRAADQRRQTVISELLKTDYRRQRQLVETLKIVKSLKAQMIEIQRQQGPAKDPAEPELPEEAGSNT
ncbi:hypothetical protein Tco_0650732 [Tanacetum coccineum]